MVYNICFIPKTKRTYIYKQYQFLKHFSVNLFMRRHFETSSSRLFNKLAELALAIRKFSHKVKSHFLVPQMYICPFIDYVILAIFSHFLYVVRKICTFLTWFISKWWRVIVICLFQTLFTSSVVVFCCRCIHNSITY